MIIGAVPASNPPPSSLLNVLRFMGSASLFPVFVVLVFAKFRQPCQENLRYHPAAWNGRPRQAGAFRRIFTLSREITTSTMMVARYGSADTSCEGTTTGWPNRLIAPAAWIASEPYMMPPNRYAPTSSQIGR